MDTCVWRVLKLSNFVKFDKVSLSNKEWLTLLQSIDFIEKLIRKWMYLKIVMDWRLSILCDDN